MPYIPIFITSLVVVVIIILGVIQYNKGKSENFDKRDY